MTQLDLYASATIDDVRYQWLVYQEEGSDFARVDMFQLLDNGWMRYRGLEEPLFGGSAKGLLEESVSRWLAVSEENGYEVRRTA